MVTTDIALDTLAALEAAIQAASEATRLARTGITLPSHVMAEMNGKIALHDLNLAHVADHRAALEESLNFESNGISHEECYACELATFEESKQSHTRRLLDQYGVKQ